MEEGVKKRWWRALFWALLGAVHAGAAAGALWGGWLLGIMSDGVLLLCLFDALLALALGWASWRGGAKRGPGMIREALGAAALCAAMGAWYGLAPWMGPGPGPSAAGAVPGLAPLRLMQGNTEGKGNPFGFDYDVVALSEMWGGAIEAPEGVELAAGGEPGCCDAAIYTRLPKLASGRVGKPVAGWTQGVWARLSFHGKPFTMVSIHTRSPTSAEWERQRGEFLKELAAFVAGLPEGEPVVISGDWNATPTDKAFRDFLATGSFAQEPDPWWPTWPSWSARFGAGFRIDRTLGAKGARPVSWRPLPKGPSDHLFSEALIDLGR